MTDQLRAGPASRGDDERVGVWLVLRVCLLTALGLAALPFPILALPAGFLLWIGWLSLPDLRPSPRRVAIVMFGLAALAAGAGLVRFVIEHAMVGIVGGGQTATSRRAVSRLRELVFAEDLMRKNAFIDPDGDGVGSAGWIGELAGAVPLRGGQTLEIPILNHEWRRSVETPAGPAVEAGGYLFMICLPAPDGWTARSSEAADDERAERQFLAYAWPVASHPGFDALYSVDERESIRVGRPLGGVELPYVGSARPPPCDATLADSAVLQWESWENKAPRASLPGSEP